MAEEMEVVEFEDLDDSVEVPDQLRYYGEDDAPHSLRWDPEKRARLKAAARRSEIGRQRGLRVEERLRRQPTPNDYFAAACVYLDMEEGTLGNPKKWDFPPTKGKVASNREILMRIGWPVARKDRMPNRTWLESDNFLSCVEVARAYRAALRLKSSFKHYEILKVIGREGLMLMFARMMEAKEGLRPISDSILFNQVPKILRLIAEVRGDIETAGVSVNVIQQNISSIEDPERQDKVIDTLAERLREKYEERAKELGAGEIPGLPEGG